MTNPYSTLQDYHFWFKAMTAPAPGHIDPVVKYKTIKATDKVSTMGSCFAQHLAKNIAKSGFNYFVTENPPPGLDNAEATKKNYGIFSARYGNLYTVKQAVQLFDRAFGLFKPDENIWRKDSVYIDAFRPQIEPNGFESKEQLLEDRAKHLACVKTIFEESDWLILTLGLTEAWRSKKDGAIYPLAPGVAGGLFAEKDHEFVNFTANEVIADLKDFVQKATSVNPKINILLTVSPVPLIATYENRHVWVSTTVSKAALRVAADEIEKIFDHVIYFPSYEIITSPASADRYFQDDLRQVTDIGVNHVMRMFFKHFMQEEAIKEIDKELSINSVIESNLDGIVCDEEEIERAIKQAGF
ncbi:MAG: GSCFA domain-containing protein [Methylovulum sp.]|uniref:GSCFA domain-containing protein n=1 Tax=Methylovulum sp. TaxID=1916980 RepID=UPI00260EE5A2|nr:GSCFA domain-containing protein [Methylovulum sp.]MDD2722833.1 GSCFA domain-containing protein [Methylovulum sp.]MDD5124405.1 GSCFA domain-containing protein [Methylovulum sp.]